jgi:TPP-dependent pyruvate/acetoin dehydrogenase alpha subunit
MEEQATEDVAASIKFAEESEQPDPSELFTDVVAEHGPVPIDRDQYQ